MLLFEEESRAQYVCELFLAESQRAIDKRGNLAIGPFSS